ncbi:MAG: hypothetical protein GXO10_01910 [Crenarchaeota archaeon]|nr:hypothetical protein [Thermoproteota archaeon]
MYSDSSIDELRKLLEEVIRLLEQLLSRNYETRTDGGLDDRDFWYFYNLWKTSHDLEESLARLIRCISCHYFKRFPREILDLLDLLSSLWKFVYKLTNVSLQAKHIALSKPVYVDKSEDIVRLLSKYRKRIDYFIKNLSSFLEKLYYYRNVIGKVQELLKDNIDDKGDKKFREYLDYFLDVAKG